MTELIIVRHGQTDYNLNRMAQGHLDIPLNETGRKQAAALAGRFEKGDFSAIYSSDLRRAFATAQAAADKTGHEIRIDERLRERHMGIFQGVPLEEISERFPEAYKRFHAYDPEFVVPEGEGLRQFYERSLAAFAEIAQAHEEQRVLIFTHGGNLGALLRKTLGLPIASKRKYHNRNTSVSCFQFSENDWMMKTWGDCAHLENDHL